MGDKIYTNDLHKIYTKFTTNTACYFLFVVDESMGNKYIGQELGAFLQKMELGRETKGNQKGQR